MFSSTIIADSNNYLLIWKLPKNILRLQQAMLINTFSQN